MESSVKLSFPESLSGELNKIWSVEVGPGLASLLVHESLVILNVGDADAGLLLAYEFNLFLSWKRQREEFNSFESGPEIPLADASSSEKRAIRTNTRTHS